MAFPDTDHASNIELLDDDGMSYRLPVGWGEANVLERLVSLKAFTENKSENHGSKLLVCIKTVSQSNHVDYGFQSE